MSIYKYKVGESVDLHFCCENNVCRSRKIKVLDRKKQRTQSGKVYRVASLGFVDEKWLGNQCVMAEG